eukprot:GFUD01133544.1.p1 GENE.GFUD01133544.1~~GFUD01133544.1.p1  ORF type:complete len:218 (-),score=38.83 GFUD01133544.1:164-817(-)
MPAHFHADNWGGYLAAFRHHFQILGSTDPDRFPTSYATDAFTSVGHWVPYTVPDVWTHFSCHLHGAEKLKWNSVEGQVDLKFRYNFVEKRGEVKIVREMRQRCPRLLHEMESHPWQYPRLGHGEAGWVMRRLARRIERKYYGEWEPAERSGCRWSKRKNTRRHEKGDCEACQLGRCPWVRNMNTSGHHWRKGEDGYNIYNLERIEWVLLDENEHAFH